MNIIFPFIFLLIFLSIFVFYFLFMLNLILMGGHDLPTSPSAIKKIIKIISAKSQTKNNLKFYDLGCGRGNVLFAVKKAFPEFSVIGIEKSLLQIFFCKLKNFILRQEISFQKADLLGVNLNEADIIYIYLYQDLMLKIEPKLKKELKPGVMVITNTTSFPSWELEETYIVHPKKPDFEKLFLYTKKS